MNESIWKWRSNWIEFSQLELRYKLWEIFLVIFCCILAWKLTQEQRVIFSALDFNGRMLKSSSIFVRFHFICFLIPQRSLKYFHCVASARIMICSQFVLKILINKIKHGLSLKTRLFIPAADAKLLQNDRSMAFRIVHEFVSMIRRKACVISAIGFRFNWIAQSGRRR